MSTSARHKLPLLEAEQALKHITHNEMVTLLDILVATRIEAFEAAMPPPAPVQGHCYALGNDPEGVWAGQAGTIASWTAGGWRFVEPMESMLAWDVARGVHRTFRAGLWVAVFDHLDGIGIGGASDGINRLAVKSEAALFTAVPGAESGNGNVRLTVNKEAMGDSATVLFQSGFSGRAEIGLAGSDDFVFKVSADGVQFVKAMTIEASGGFVVAETLLGARLSNPAVAAGVLAVSTSHVAPVPEDGTSDEIESLSGGFDGALLIVSGSDGLSLTLRGGVGNLRLGADRLLEGAADTLLLVRRGGEWIELSYARNI